MRDDRRPFTWALAARGIAALLLLVSISFAVLGCEDVATDSGADSAVYDEPSGDQRDPSVEEEQLDWENREGEQWDAYSTAFADGGSSACQDFFNQTDNGSMYNDDYEYTAVDCENAFSSDPDNSGYVEVPSEPPYDAESDGDEAGREAACQEFFDTESVDELYWGTDAYTADDCTGGSGPSGSTDSAPAPAPEAEPSTAPQKAAGYESCDQNISAKRGTTTCAFALNTFYEYWNSDQSSTVSVWSPKADRYFSTSCSSDGSQVRCTTGDGGVVRFPQAAVDAYSESQARSYRSGADLGPGD